MTDFRSNRKEIISELLQLDLSLLDVSIKQNLRLGFRINSASLLINNNAGQDYDEKYVDNLSDDNLDKLIRILVIYENHHFKGSASAVPNLLKILFQRQYKKFQSLFDWVIQNNQNEYVPMGTFKGQNVKSINDYASKISL